MHMLLVLLWKHKRSRLNTWLKTIVEILCPIAVFVFFYCIKDHLLGVKENLDEVRNTEAIPINVIPTPGLVLCYPQTPQTELLMKEVGDKLLIKHLNREPVNGRSRGYYFITNASYIELYADKLLDDEALVIFQNMNDKCPENLNYTIRIKNDFKTKEYLPKERVLQPHSGFGTMYETFIRLQWAVDSSFLRTCLRTNVSKIVSFQEFPNKVEVERLTLCVVTYLTLVLIALLSIFTSHTTRIMEERDSGILELMKISGVSTLMHGLSHFLNGFPIGALFSLVGTVVLTVGAVPVLPKTSAFLLLCVMFLTFVSYVALAFITAHALPLMTDASTIAWFIYILVTLPSVVFMSTMRDSGLFVRLQTGLFPFVPLHWFLLIAAEFEDFHDRGITFKTMFKTSVLHKVSPFHGFLCLFFQIALYWALAYYMALVRPGRNGVALKWNFICDKLREKDRSDQDTESNELQIPEIRGPYFEECTPPNQHGIKICRVTKFFDRTKVLNNINMNIYEGEITVLLGHNGAGKTTLMTIAAGLQKASSGKVFVEGMDITKNKSKVIKLIGICPQENIFFKDLTVLDHAMLFTMIRRNCSIRQARAISVSLLGRLNLGSKQKSLVDKLSGGMKRRLQLCMAMAGDARVLILDEPTSGLDVETRRDLWNLLLTLRGNRTVVLSTHFMEEADALGDRIAALHSGELKCYATPMFLKKAIGEGYRLTLVTLGLPKDPQISHIIFETIPEATLKVKTTNSLSYNLPSVSAPKFSTLFQQLESSKEDLGIESIGLGTSTLDEVFMRLCSDTPVAEPDAENIELEDTEHEKIKGFKLIINQVKALLWRHYKYLFFKKWHYLTFAICFPMFLMFVMIWSMKNGAAFEDTNRSLRIDLDVYKDLTNIKVLHNIYPEQEINLMAVKARYPDVQFEAVDDVAEYVLRSSQQKTEDYNRCLIGLEVNGTHATVLFSTTYRHAAPVALNLLSNAFALLNESSTRTATRAFADDVSKNPITIYNDPVEGTIQYNVAKTVNYLPKSATDVTFLAKTIPGFVLLAITWCLAPLFAEKVNSQRHILMMSGCSPATYWSTTLGWFTLIFMVPLLPTIICLLVILDNTDTFKNCHLLFSLALLIVLSTMVFLSFMFWLNELLHQTAAYIVIFLCIGSFSYVVPLLRDMFPAYTFKGLDFLFAPLLFNEGTVQILTTGRVNKFCEMNRVNCRNLITAEPDFVPYVKKCCESSGDPKDYFDFDTILIFVELCGHLVLYLILTIFTQKGLFSKLLEYVYNRNYVAIPALGLEETVAKEKQFVSNAIKSPNHPDTLLVHNLHKRYVSTFCRVKFNALKGVSFSIKKNECFAVLGINGAGKTTMFQALTAEIPFTRGTVICNGQRYSKSKKYLQSLGYCSQHNSMDVFLTGLENLQLLLILRGLTAEDAEKEGKLLIKMLALEKYTNKLVLMYSGGCRRRLAAGASLCGAALSVLDEPSTGVDVAARRALWAALRRRNSMLVASHSMEEVEALATRVLILAGGMVRALGSPAELRAKHANGHSLRILLNAHSLKHSELGILKEDIKKTFKCTVRDAHKTMLYYHIDETMRYSEIFAKLEALKSNFSDLIVDYSVQETTLEEVFLSFTKEPTQDSPRRRDTRQLSVLI